LKHHDYPSFLPAWKTLFVQPFFLFFVMRIAFYEHEGSGFWDRRLGLCYTDNELYCLRLEIIALLELLLVSCVIIYLARLASLTNPLAIVAWVAQAVKDECIM
jgi:hypothetical protein